MAALLLVALAVVASPFLTYYLSNYLFEQTVRSPEIGKTPPKLPAYIPGIWPGVTIIKDGLPAFISNIIKRYGELAPFVVRAGPLSFLLIRDAAQIKRVLESENMTPKGRHGRLFDKTFGTPQATLAAIQATAAGRSRSEDLDYVHSRVPRQYCSGAGLKSMAEAYTGLLSQNLGNKMFQDRTWTEIEDLWSFLQIEVTRAMLTTLFGQKLLKVYPKVMKDLWEFDANLDSLSTGMPRFLIPNAYKMRDRLLENLEKWLKSTNGYEAQSTASESEGTAWDPNQGAGYFRATDRAITELGFADGQTRAAAALAMMHWTVTNITPMAFWAIFETLRNPKLGEHLVASFDQHCNPTTAAYDIPALTAIPLFKSMYTEISRLRTTTCTIRVNESEDFALDGDWTIPKGTEIRILSQDLALDTSAWTNARPQTVERPLTEFWVDRFIVFSGHKTKKGKDAIRSGPFSIESVDKLLTAFGGGPHLCPGRFMAQVLQCGTLSVLLCEYEIQLSDAEEAEMAVPPVPGLAFGTVKPLGPIRMRIRKRGAPKS